MLLEDSSKKSSSTYSIQSQSIDTHKEDNYNYQLTSSPTIQDHKRYLKHSKLYSNSEKETSKAFLIFGSDTYSVPLSPCIEEINHYTNSRESTSKTFAESTSLATFLAQKEEEKPFLIAETTTKKQQRVKFVATSSLIHSRSDQGHLLLKGQNIIENSDAKEAVLFQSNQAKIHLNIKKTLATKAIQDQQSKLKRGLKMLESLYKQ